MSARDTRIPASKTLIPAISNRGTDCACGWTYVNTVAMRLSWILVAAAAALVLYLEVLPRWAAHQQPAFAGQRLRPRAEVGAEALALLTLM
jgi:hypothetical protein